MCQAATPSRKFLVKFFSFFEAILNINKGALIEPLPVLYIGTYFPLPGSTPRPLKNPQKNFATPIPYFHILPVLFSQCHPIDHSEKDHCCYDTHYQVIGFHIHPPYRAAASVNINAMTPYIANVKIRIRIIAWLDFFTVAFTRLHLLIEIVCPIRR